MRLKITLKTTIFILVFAITLTAITGVLVTVDNMGYQNIAGFYEEPNNSLDAVYIGSSNCFVFWNSLLAWEEYGISVYPYACNSNLFYSTEYLIKEAKKTQPDALFIVNINSLTDGEVNIQQFRNLIDCMPFSLNKLALINHLADIGDYSFSERLEFYFPIIRYHTRWTEISTSDFSSEYNGLKGASTFETYLKTSNDVTSTYVTTDAKANLSDKLVSSTESLLDYCDEENVNVLFVTVPQSRGNEYDMSRYNAVNAMIEERGYTVLDLTERIGEMDIDMATDYYNGGHTNIHGSIKLTYFLSEYLIEHYGFTDKRNNDDYSSWNRSYEEYADIIAPYILDFETDSGVRTDLLEAPTLEFEKNNADGILSWNSIAEADGYIVYLKTSSDSAWERLAETTEVNYTVLLPKEEETHYYTVVPFLEDNGCKYYGDYFYEGIELTASE